MIRASDFDAVGRRKGGPASTHSTARSPRFLAGAVSLALATALSLGAAQARPGFVPFPSVPNPFGHHPLTQEQQDEKANFEEQDKGFQVFTEETFEGNGRACGTCHIPSEDYNIFPATIAKMSHADRDVLITNVHGLENPTLLEKRALFNVEGDENSDATDPLTFQDQGHPVFRSTMTIQGLELTTENENENFVGSNLVPFPCNAYSFGPTPGLGVDLPQLGWAGNGSPGTPLNLAGDICHQNHGNFDIAADGSIAAFANGAIAQHSPRSLRRRAKSETPGCSPDIDKPFDSDPAYANCDPDDYDFRFATTAEVHAMDVFQRWLGRRPLSVEEMAEAGPDAASGLGNSEFDITKLDFKDDRINKARTFYVGGPETTTIIGGPNAGTKIHDPNFGAGCNGCHENGGAKSGIAGTIGNINVNTDVDLANIDPQSELYAVLNAALPEDEGGLFSFVAIPPPNSPTGNFNIQSIIEAPFKKGWFHNHRAIDDFEEAIAFYGSSDFIDGGPGIFTSLEDLQNGNPNTNTAFPNHDGINHLGAFLRSLGSFYRLRDCERLIDEAVERIGVGVSTDLPIRHCKFALADVSRALKGSKLRPRPFMTVALQAPLLSNLLDIAGRTRNVFALRRLRARIEKLKDRIATPVTP